MTQIIGAGIAVLVAVVMAISAAVMLASPNAWFRLPRWLRAQGSVAEDRYGAGWGAIQIRLAGAVILIAIGWVLYDLFLDR